jgi:hypothetical protein
VSLSGQEVPYDVVSFNTGSEVPVQPFLPAPRENVRPVKPVINLLQGRRHLLKLLGERDWEHYRFVNEFSNLTKKRSIKAKKSWTFILITCIAR